MINNRNEKSKSFSVLRHLLVAIAMLLLPACSVNQAEKSSSFDLSSQWTMLPFVNYSQTPQAGERAERIALTLLRRKGMNSIVGYPVIVEPNGLPVLDENKRFQQALSWAQEANFSYAISGSVEEWRYKSGLDGEPAVGVSLQVIEVASGAVLWSASGSRAGWSRESLSGTAHKVLKKLTRQLKTR